MRFPTLWARRPFWPVFLFIGLLGWLLTPASALAQPNQVLAFAPEDSLEVLQAKIQNNGYEFTVGHTWVYDLPAEQQTAFFSRHMPLRPEPKLGSTEDYGPLMGQLGKQLPTSFCWTNVNGHSYIGPVKNQGSCGGCYAFAACAAAEGTYNFATGRYDANCASFSESFILWCLGRLPQYTDHFYGCNGADYDYYELQALTVEGITDTAHYPLTLTDPGACTHWGDPTIRFAAWHRVPCGDVEAIKTAILTYGPVDAAVYVDAAFKAYTGGIFQNTSTNCDTSPCYYKPTNHAISLVGWNDNGGNGYWILRNSWGSSWGERGYMRIKYTSAYVACEATYLVYSNNLAPAITVQPASKTVSVGGTAAFSVTASGSTPLSYAWKRNGNPIAGATLSSYTVSNVQLADSGARFSCLVSNAYGTALSSNAVLTVLNSGSGVLTTLFSGGNGASGNMFDLVPKANLSLNALDVNLTPAGQAATVTVYYRNGSSFGNENSSSGWMLLGSQAITAMGSNVPTRVTLTGNGVQFLQGQTYGFYVYTDSGSMRYTDGTNTYENAELKLVTNCGKGSPAFTGSTFSPRIWNGSIYYQTGSATGAPAITAQPASQTVPAGGTATFSVTASGTAPLRYYWKRNGSPIAGATLSSYTVSNAQLADSGAQFSCLVSNAYGTALSTGAVLTVLNGSSGSLTTLFSSDNGASGNMFDIVPKANLSITALDVNMAQAGVTDTVTVYYRTGTSFGHESESTGWILLGSQTVASAGFDLPTRVSLTGNGVQFLQGQTYGLYVYANSGEMRYTDGTNTYETAELKLVTNCGKDSPPFSGGTFSPRIWNGTLYYETGSTVAAPAIVAQPQSITTTVGATATFGVTASGTAPLRYYWKRNGNPIAGATLASYSAGNVQLADSGARFSCLVSNAYGTALSADAVLTVFQPGTGLITFDELSGTNGSPVPNGYHGLDWSSLAYQDASDASGGYLAGIVSPPRVAYNAWGKPASLTSTGAFNLVSAYLTAAWNDNLQLQVKGYAGSTLAYDRTYTLSATAPTLITFNYNGVTAVDFISSGGTPHSGYGGSGTHFVIDNITIGNGPTAGVDHFAWSTIASPQQVAVAFPVTVTAKDAFNATVTDFTGTVSFRASAGGQSATYSMLNQSPTTAYTNDSYTDGYAFTPNVDLVVTRVRHYEGTKVSIWTESGALVVAQAVTSVPGTWLETPLATPVTLSAGTRYRIGAYYPAGATYYSITNPPTTFTHGTIQGGYYSSGDACPTLSWSYIAPVDLCYSVGAAGPVPISPTLSGNFVNGVWSGSLSVQQTATDVVLTAEDGAGHSGASNPFLVGGSATHLRIAIYGAAATDTNENQLCNLDVKAKIVATGLFADADVDVFSAVAPAPVPTLAQLQQYAAILTFSNGRFMDSTNFGNVLADYLESGGGVVLATDGFDSDLPWGIQGRLVSAGYLPLSQGDAVFSPAHLTLVSDLPSHPLLQGVASFDSGAESFHNNVTLAAGATLVAHWSDGHPLLAVKTPGNSRIAGLNFWPPSTDADTYGWQAGTDGGRIMANALRWAANAAATNLPPAITAQPASQTVPVGGTAAFSVTASGAAPLSYYWKRNGSPIAGATLSSYTVNNAQSADSGAQFSCLVSNAYGTALSSNAVLTVTVTPAPLLAVTAVSLDFGAVAVGSFATRTLYVTNVGGGTLAGTASVPAPFSIVSGGTYNLAASQGQAVVVNYSPTVAGNDSATVSFTGGGGAAVTVTGRTPQLVPLYSFTNKTAIAINDATPLGLASPASPYPASINVAGLSGTVSNVTVTLRGFTHTYPHDAGVLLVGPKGQKVVLLANSGGYGVANLTLTFDDRAATGLTEYPGSPIASGTYKPSNCGAGDATFPTGAPAGPYASTLSVCNGSSPNGVWSLYVQDDSSGDAGTIANGWSLSFDLLTAPQPPVITNQPQSQTLIAGQNAVFTVGATNAQAYSWQMNGIDLTDGGRISGSKTSRLILANTSTNDSGSRFTCLVSSSYGSVTSADAFLTVLPGWTAFLTTPVLVNGHLQFTLNGAPTSNYVVYTSSDLVNWKTLTLVNATNGSANVLDPSTGLSRRFYRAKLAP